MCVRFFSAAVAAPFPNQIFHVLLYVILITSEEWITARGRSQSIGIEPVRRDDSFKMIPIAMNGSFPKMYAEKVRLDFNAPGMLAPLSFGAEHDMESWLFTLRSGLRIAFTQADNSAAEFPHSNAQLNAKWK